MKDKIIFSLEIFHDSKNDYHNATFHRDYTNASEVLAILKILKNEYDEILNEELKPIDANGDEL